MVSSCLLGGWRGAAATVIWTNASGGSWLVPQNWDPNLVPTGLTDIAVITNSGTYTVTLDSGLAIASITLGAVDGAGTQTLSWRGGILSDCSVTIAVKGVLNLDGPEDKSLRRCKVNNAGTIAWSGTGKLIGAVDGFSQSVLITNLAGGLFDIQTDANIGYSDPGYGIAAYVFHNAGTLCKSAGPGTNGIDSHLAFINHGTVELQQGGLQFPNGFNSGGTFSLATNTVVNLDGGTFTFDSSSFKTGAGQLLVDAGDVALNGTVPGLNWTGGRLVGSGFTVAKNGVMTISGSANKVLLRSTLSNAGTVILSGSGQLVGAVDGFSQSVLITNLVGGVFDIQNDSAVGFSDPGYGIAAYVFHNAGTLRKSAGAGATTFASQCAFVNSGSILVEQGTIVFPGFQNDGSLTVQPGAAVTFPLGFVNNGSFNLNGDARANSTGGACSFGPASQLTGTGQWTIPTGDVTLTGTIPSLNWAGGRLVGSTFTVATNAVLSISGAATKTLVRSQFNNAGTVLWTGAGQLIGTMDYYNQFVLITNQVSGLFDIQTDANIGYAEAKYGLLYVFHNAGTLRKSASTGTNTFHGNLASINTGVVELQQGGLLFPNGFNSSGTFNLAASTAVNLDGGAFTFGASSLKTGAGQSLVDGGDVTLTGAIPSLNWSGGRLVGSGFTVAAGAELAISGSADKVFVRTAINNAGTITWAAAGQLIGTVDGYSQSVLITNLAGGVFDIQKDSGVGFSDPGYGIAAYVFHNAGTLRKSAGSGTNMLASQCAFINSGRAELRTGALQFNAAFAQTASGTLALQNLNPVAPQVRLNIIGTAALDGVLEVSLLPNLAAPGQTFAAMTYGASTGSFSSRVGLQLDGGLWLRPAITAHALMLNVESAPKFYTPQVSADGFKLQWHGAPGVDCRLDASTNLIDWVTLISTNSPDGLGVYIDSDSLVLPQRYYRLAPQ
jgi:hypothetical protein